MKDKTNVWLEFASRDIQAAKKLISDKYVANIVLFHSEQCIEKCMKAILEEYNQNIPKIHGIHKLYSLVKKNTSITLPVTSVIQQTILIFR
jgi:HEPN domain-containing protein